MKFNLTIGLVNIGLVCLIVTGAMDGNSTNQKKSNEQPFKLKPVIIDAFSYSWKSLTNGDVSVRASSELCENKLCYEAKNVMDRHTGTAWCEASGDKGAEEWIEFVFAKIESVDGFFIAPFYAKDRQTVFNNSRPKRIEIVTDSQSLLIEFPDASPYPDMPPEMNHLAPADVFPSEIFDIRFRNLVGHSIKTRTLRFLVREVYPGEKVQDMCLSEIHVNLTRLKHTPEQLKTTKDNPLKQKTTLKFVCPRDGSKYILPSQSQDAIKAKKEKGYRCKLCGRIIRIP